MIQSLSKSAFVRPRTINCPLEQVLTQEPQPDISSELYDIEIVVPVITHGRAFDITENGEINLEFAREMYDAGGLHIFSTNVPFRERIALEELDDDGIEYGIEVTPLEFYTNRMTLEEVSCFVSIRGQPHGKIPEVSGWSGKYPLLLGNITSSHCDIEGGEYLVFRAGMGEFEERRAYDNYGVHFPHAQLLRGVQGKLNSPVVSDTDCIQTPGDVAIALGLGSTAVMASRLFAGVIETPGGIYYIDNNAYQRYHPQESDIKYESVMVPYEAKTIREVMLEISESIRTALLYAGVSNLEEFRQGSVILKRDDLS